MHDLTDKSMLRGGLAGWQAKKMLAMAATRLPDLSVGSMAAAVGLSRDHFSRAFRISFGLSPREWLLQQKMRSGCERLQNTKDSVDQIAADLGYRTSSQFCRVFRARFGISPQQFRRN